MAKNLDFVDVYSDGTWKKAVPSMRSSAQSKSPENVSLFFDDYVGKTIKFSVWVGTITVTEDRTGKKYGILVKSEDGRIFTSEIYKRSVKALNFVLSEDMARKTIEAQEQFSHTVDGRANETVVRGANIYAEIIKTEDYNIANVLCIEFTGNESKKGIVSSIIIKSIGC
jgi:hypothetical protein